MWSKVTFKKKSKGGKGEVKVKWSVGPPSSFWVVLHSCLPPLGWCCFPPSTRKPEWKHLNYLIQFNDPQGRRGEAAHHPRGGRRGKQHHPKGEGREARHRKEWEGSTQQERGTTAQPTRWEGNSGTSPKRKGTATPLTRRWQPHHRRRRTVRTALPPAFSTMVLHSPQVVRLSPTHFGTVLLSLLFSSCEKIKEKQNNPNGGGEQSSPLKGERRRQHHPRRGGWRHAAPLQRRRIERSTPPKEEEELASRLSTIGVYDRARSCTRAGHRASSLPPRWKEAMLWSQVDQHFLIHVKKWDIICIIHVQ